MSFILKIILVEVIGTYMNGGCSSNITFAKSYILMLCFCAKTMPNASIVDVILSTQYIIARSANGTFPFSRDDEENKVGVKCRQTFFVITSLQYMRHLINYIGSYRIIRKYLLGMQCCFLIIISNFLMMTCWLDFCMVIHSPVRLEAGQELKNGQFGSQVTFTM